MKNKLRFKAKKNRAKIKLILGKNCLSNIHITYCLDKILSQKPNIKSVAPVSYTHLTLPTTPYV